MTTWEFADALDRAVVGLMITPVEAKTALDVYRREVGMELQAGKFYVARDGKIWCCFRVNKKAQVQAQADCICVEDSRVEYFFIDGRYDSSGRREHTLIREVPAPA